MSKAAANRHCGIRFWIRSSLMHPENIYLIFYVLTLFGKYTPFVGFTVMPNYLFCTWYLSFQSHIGPEAMERIQRKSGNLFRHRYFLCRGIQNTRRNKDTERQNRIHQHPWFGLILCLHASRTTRQLDKLRHRRQLSDTEHWPKQNHRRKRQCPHFAGWNPERPETMERRHKNRIHLCPLPDPLFGTQQRSRTLPDIIHSAQLRHRCVKQYQNNFQAL